LSYGFSSAFGRLIGVILIPIMTSVFSPTEFGIIDVIVSSVTLIVAVVSLNLESALQRYYFEYEKQEAKNEFFSTIINFTTLLSISTIFIIFSFKEPLAHAIAIQHQYSYMIVVGVIIALIQFILALFLINYRLENSVYKYVISSMSVSCLNGLLLPFFLLALKRGMQGYFDSMLYANIIPLVVVYMFERKMLTLSMNFTLLKRCMRFSLPGLISVLTNNIMLILPRYLILFMSNFNSVGLYAFAIRLNSLLLFVTSTFQMTWTPYALKIMDNDDSRTIYNTIYKHVLFIVIIAAGAIIACFSLLCRYLANSQYYESLPYLKWLLYTTVIGFQQMFFHLPFTIKERTVYLSVGQIVGALVTIVIGVLLVRAIGPVGAPIGLAIGTLCQMEYLYLYSRRIYHIKYSIIRASIAILCLVIFGETSSLFTANYTVIITGLLVFVCIQAMLLLNYTGNMHPNSWKRQ